MSQFTKNAITGQTFVQEIKKEKTFVFFRRISLGLMSCLFGNLGFAQVIAWDFGSETENKFPSVIIANVSVSELKVNNNNGDRTDLLTTVSPSGGYTGATGNFNAGAAVPVQTFNTATNTYFEFTLTPDQGFSLTINSINFGSRSTGTGPQAYSIRSSLDSYNSDVATGNFNPNSTWRLFTNSNLSVSNTNAVTIRIYGFNNTGSPGKNVANWRIDDLTLNITLVPVIQSYRSRQDGNWKNLTTWESSADGVNWNSALTFPSKEDGAILIRQGHTVVVNSAVDLDQVVIQGTLELQTGGILNINDGEGDELEITGNGNLKIITSSNFATAIKGTGLSTIHVLTNGKITVGNGTSVGSGYEELATSDKNKWDHGSVLEYNSTSTFAIAGLIFFPNAATSEIPIFRVTKIGGSVAAPKDFFLNGLMEVNADLTFTGAGKKNIRNGIRGNALLTQLNAGKLILNGDKAILEGSSLRINLAQPMDLALSTIIPTGSYVTILGSNISNSLRTLTINGVLDMTTSGITNTSGTINIIGTYRTAHSGGFSGGSSSIPSDKNIFVNAGSTIELYSNTDQNLIARKDFSNLIFSGSGRKVPSGAFNPAGTVTIKDNAIFDCSGRNIGDETSGTPTSTHLTMTGNSRLIVDTYGPNPKMAGTYKLTGGVIEFKNSGATPQTIRSKYYQNIEITGSNVLMGEGNIYLNDKGSFIVKSGSIFSMNDNTIIGNGKGNQLITVESMGTFRCGNNLGFNGAQITSVPIKSSAINTDITNIILQKNSTVEYTRNGDQPITNANGLVYQNIVLSGTGIKTAPAGNLYILGNFSRTSSATFFHNNGTIIFNGTEPQTFTSALASTIFYNFINNNPSALNISSSLSVSRKFSLEPGSKILLNEDITFLSNKNQTAFISRLSANVKIDYNKGRFVVERFINTNTVDGGHLKSWQFISTPAFGETIFNTWQEKGNVTTGYGTWITGPSGTDKGFDAFSLAPSMKYYNETNNSWTGISGTDNYLEKEKGYMVFIRGDRKSNSINSSATPTVLRTRGKLYSTEFPPPSISVSPKKFESVGNPYASAIDFLQLQTKNLTNGYIAFDPTLGGDYGVGGYQTISAATNFKPVPGGTSNYNNATNYRFIQSGQAFFVYNFTELPGLLSFSEDCKTEDNHHLVNRLTGTQKQILFANIKKEDGTVVDGNAMVFDDNFSDKDNPYDVVKIMNGQEYFGIAGKNKILTIEARTEINSNDTIFYNITNLNKQNYVMWFNPENINASTNAFIVDNYLQTENEINLKDTSSFLFNVNSDKMSAREDRFYLLFRNRNDAKTFAVPSINAILEGRNVKIFWESENDNSIIQYEIDHSTDGINFSTIDKVLFEPNSKKDYLFNHTQPPQGLNYYRLKITMMDGTIELSSVINIYVPEFESKILIYPNPIKNGHIQIHFSNQLPGKYALILYNLIGQKLLVKEIEFPGGSKTEIIPLQKNNFHKVGRLEIIKPNGNKIFIAVAQ